MEQKKNSKIILIAMILLMFMIIITGIAYAYFTTDLWKSNQALFLKYMTQIGEEKEGLIDKQLKDYFAKQKTTPYTNQGSLSVNVVSENNASQQDETINQFRIDFSGENDQTNQAFNQNITLHYTSDLTFPIQYRKIGNAIGLQTKYVGNKYLVVETDKLEEGAFVGTEDIIPMLQTAEKMTKQPFHKEELKQLLEKYINIVEGQLQDTQFSKIEEEGKKGYQLTLNGEQTKEMVKVWLENLKNDQKTLDKINEFQTTRITASTIDGYIREIERNSEWKQKNTQITVFEQNGKLVKLQIKIQETEITIEEKKENNILDYTISYKGSSESIIKGITFNIQYTGLETLQNVNENYQIEIQLADETTYQYKIENQNNFTQFVQVEEFSNENAMILNQYEKEQVNPFLEQVKERILLVNQQQMEELGVEQTDNPFIQMLAPLSAINQKNAEEMTKNKEEVTELEVTSFNQKFENYESTNLQGVTVKGLLSTIQLNNESQQYTSRKIKEIHFDGKEYEVTDQNIILIKSNVEIDTAYRVEFEREENTGLIYRAVINKK